MSRKKGPHLTRNPDPINHPEKTTAAETTLELLLPHLAYGFAAAESPEDYLVLDEGLCGDSSAWDLKHCFEILMDDQVHTIERARAARQTIRDIPSPSGISMFDREALAQDAYDRVIRDGNATQARVILHTHALFLKLMLDDPDFPDDQPDRGHWGVPLEECLSTAIIWEFG